MNPDWLIVIDRAAGIGSPDTAARQTLDNALVGETKAWKKGQVIYLDAAKIYVASGGYNATLGTLRELADAFEKSM